MAEAPAPIALWVRQERWDGKSGWSQGWKQLQKNTAEGGLKGSCAHVSIISWDNTRFHKMSSFPEGVFSGAMSVFFSGGGTNETEKPGTMKV